METNINKTEEAWHQYIYNHIALPDHINEVRDEIVQSWKRSQCYVEYNNVNRTFVSHKELESRLSYNSLFLQIAYPYLLHFSHYLGDTEYIITLNDSDGCQLKHIVNTHNQYLFEEDWVDGCFYSEKEVGTGGIGISLALEKPMLVIGPEHYQKRYHELVCYTAPLFDSHNRLLGLINITSTYVSYSPLIMGMLMTAVNGIERELTLTKYNRRIQLMVQSFKEGVILLNDNLHILNYNDEILNILHLSDNIEDKNINEVIKFLDLPEVYKDLRKDISNIICTIQSSNNVMIDILLSILHPMDINDTILIKIESLDKVNKQTNINAGFIASYTLDSLKGNSYIMNSIKELSKIYADMNYPILISGEEGTGKTMLAQAIHNASKYRTGAFIQIRCNNLLNVQFSEELWGHEGYIQGSKYINTVPGKLELANYGTIYLQNIESISLDMQDKLYDFLVTHIYKRNGSKLEKQMDIQFIASTSKNIYELMNNKLFNSELYYLLTSHHLILPPLRERKEDIITISKDIVERFNKHLKFDQDTIEALISYKWPGNVIQLENVIESVINTSKDKITLYDLPLDIINERYIQRENTLFISQNNKINNQLLEKELKEYNRILTAIKKAQGNVSQASLDLHMPVSTLYRKLTKYDLNPKDYK